ncbi:MAG TPA: T9SS type A sorting domain-containing protein, partial [Candidatus Cloacimonetes bacterium]|nr:T9SS type A sorting domain-containing protein [Candidatus Cloacimonadota bacterium]HEX38010.1 T9SS type A sorting domain-containing protein [Candidatus Cloacimonadota bacterium]
GGLVTSFRVRDNFSWEAAASQENPNLLKICQICYQCICDLHINHYDNVAVLTIPEQNDPGSGLIPEPELFGLFQNEPNPVINSTRISFNLPEISQVDLAVYNLKGQLVKKLYSGNTSKHTIMWDGKDEQGNELENGVYFYTIIINEKIENTRKLIIMK